MIINVSVINPIFIDIGIVTIYWYGLIIAFGTALGIFLAIREANRLQLKKDIIIDLMIVAIPISIISARIYYVLFEWGHYADHSWWKIFAVWEGGLAIHGAVIGGIITAVIFARNRKVSFWQLADVIAPSLILGQAIGRWGNFMNQEAHGGPISTTTYENFHQYLPDFIMNQMTIDGVMYHPTFLYESVWNILLFILLIVIRKYNPLRGAIFLSYIMTYSIGRYFIEGMRTDSLYMFGEIRTAQFISVLLIVVAVSIYLYRRKIVTTHYYDLPKIKKRKKS